MTELIETGKNYTFETVGKVTGENGKKYFCKERGKFSNFHFFGAEKIERVKIPCFPINCVIRILKS